MTPCHLAPEGSGASPRSLQRQPGDLPDTAKAYLLIEQFRMSIEGIQHEQGPEVTHRHALAVASRGHFDGFEVGSALAKSSRGIARDGLIDGGVSKMTKLLRIIAYDKRGIINDLQKF